MLPHAVLIMSSNNSFKDDKHQTVKYKRVVSLGQRFLSKIYLH